MSLITALQTLATAITDIVVKAPQAVTALTSLVTFLNNPGLV